MQSIGEIAASLKLPVFPCDNEKRPCLKGGLLSAVTDTTKIREIFGAPNATLIGVPTGPVSGLVAIDIDIRDGADGMAWLNSHASDLPMTRTHKTRSGGLHLIFKYPEGFEIRNSAGKMALGVDIRGSGGYIVYPPSPGYQIADPTAPADMPMWLITACRQANNKTAEPVNRRQPIHDPIPSGGTRYGLKGLEDELEEVRRAPFGQQETTLNAAALKIGALVAGGQLDAASARSALIAAGNSLSNEAGKRPWTPQDVEAKVIRGMADGSNSPRRPKERLLNGNHQKIQGTPQKTMVDDPKEIAPADTSKAPKEENDILPVTSFLEAKANINTADFVQGLLIENTISIVYGQSNAGKTFWVTDMAFHVAAGKAWNNKEVKQGTVLYLALEGSYGIFNRIAAFKEKHGMDDQDIPFLVASLGLNLLEPHADTDRVIRTAKYCEQRYETKIILIVIDTVARAIAGGNENSSEDMGAFVRNLDLIKQETGAHVLGIHHSGKDEAKGARGWSGLRGAIDTEIEVKADGELKSAKVEKQRDLPKGDEFNFKLEVVILGKNDRGDDVTSCVVVPFEATMETKRKRTLSGNPKRLLEVLNDCLAQSGAPGLGAPPGVSSVPEKWWRERFYDCSMAGADAKTKQNAFRRAADHLLNNHFIVLRAGRVWTVQQQPDNLRDYSS
jgi:hypothetical protein